MFKSLLGKTPESFQLIFARRKFKSHNLRELNALYRTLDKLSHFSETEEERRVYGKLVLEVKREIESRSGRGTVR